MLQRLARNPRTIAWFLVSLFYLQLVLIPVVTRANGRPLPMYRLYGTDAWKNTKAIKEAPKASSKEKSPNNVPTDEVVKKANSPVHVKRGVTTGPTQPEMQSFQSVNSNNLVDPFTGDFSYNIPLLDVGGYPVNLHYQSGITMDQEASWVGLGWNINPGAISRNMRGLPDDFKGEDQIEKTISIKPNKTIGGTITKGVELFGGPLNLGSSLSFGVFHNTYKGWGIETGRSISIGVGVGAHGSLTGGLTMSSNSQNGTDVSPSMGFQIGSREAQLQGGITVGTTYNTRTGIQNLQISGEIKRQGNSDKNLRFNPGVRFSNSISFSRPSYTPTITIPYTSRGTSFRLKAGMEYPGAFNYGSLAGYMSTQEVKQKTVKMPAYGYLYYEQANNNQHVLLDYNREKDIAWSEHSPHIAIPIYTYDTWSISGEGTGGMFRPYRSDIGFVFDHKMITTSDNDNIGADLGFGNIFKAGVDVNIVDAVTKNNAWMADNKLVGVIPFKQADTTFENVYFKNPGEKTAVDKLYQHAIGGDSLMRVDLSASGGNSVVTAMPDLTLFKNAQPAGSVSFNANTLRKQRDKRTQVISYLNAREAAEVGLDKLIRSYPINNFPSTSCSPVTSITRYDGIRKKHHLSEITVLNPDGRRYVYGIPVYNVTQVEVTMSTDKGDNTTGLVNYTPNVDNSPGNSKGKDGYFNKEVIPPYSHSFLLSGILSNDYVDLTGDGITEDDMGDAVKFNYSQVYDLGSPYQWRAPYQETAASYNEGLKSDSRDEKGSYTYGTRDVWYLNSVESKTMIATFVLDADRRDAYGAKGENGGKGTQKLYRLKEINLYTKADFMKNGASQARPIKTVHFEYSYELCKANPASLSDSGKLTLKKVWFSYNGNNKGKRNPYLFTYGGPNPNFSQKSVDRWGNYKNPANNPGTTGGPSTNADYPYTMQAGINNWTETKANDSVAPWTLTEIKLPSGGRLHVTYESDDYAYVQNKRAMQFFSIAGFGNSPNGSIVPALYPKNTANNDYQYVFINVTDTVRTRDDISRKYLDGVTQLFLKMAVNMPGDRWGNGYELVPCYAEIEDYSVRSSKIICIKVKFIEGKKSPFATAAIQFLRLNLPSKAYPWSEPGDNIDIRTAVGMLGSVASSIVNLLLSASGFDNNMRIKNNCNAVVPDKSFARLDNPIYRKFGGGLRVKQTEIYDNWKAMTAKTGKTREEAVYGQAYTYTDTVLINGVRTGISSGVASYEPMIGGDENPFHVPAKVYSEKVGALAPTNFMYTEEPFAETFFPGPSVGYSKIRVQTIHRKNLSANGFEETEFYTSKDFPTLVEYTPIDDDSKKSYKSPIPNPFFFDARNYVTLSQGFKIELNDMNGKPKSQSTYAQNNLNDPISYTYNYYRLVNDNAGQPRLSNTVAIADSVNGKIDMAGEIGKEVEIMVDVREQTSSTRSANIEANLDLIGLTPPIVVPVVTLIPLFNGETNQYRAVSVLKIVNRYGILDSVIHIEKGSKVTTRNLVYDGETGDVLVSQTNNEFDDPVYNFNYPAHWAYTGMEPAYRNIGTLLKNVTFRKGILKNSSNARVPAERYFESGDELLVYGYDKRISTTNDNCAPDYYTFKRDSLRYRKVWAIDAYQGKEKQKGIYFVDRDGIPYSCDADFVRIVRSGKRNMGGASVGSITSLESPIRKVNDTMRLVFDTATHVVAATAARFKDLWAVDSMTYAKDTQVISARQVYEEVPVMSYATDHYTISDTRDGGGSRSLVDRRAWDYFEASSKEFGGGSHSDDHKMSWLKFDMTGIPQGALITSARLHLFGRSDLWQQNYRVTNACYLERLKGSWLRKALPLHPSGNDLSAYFYDNDHTTLDTNNRVLLPETTFGQDEFRNEDIVITAMAQNMLDQYYNSDRAIDPGIRISLLNKADGKTADKENKLSYNHNEPRSCPETNTDDCRPYIEIRYLKPCENGAQPEKREESGSESRMAAPLAAFPSASYYCYDQLVDSLICRPNINDTATNYYRFGILGNWRLDRAYTYYGNRVQTDPSDSTSIRTDGVIKDFAPYWTFTNTGLTASIDVGRWVWNSELSRFNNKGYEIENHDPLDRHNSGQYGYNQSLPIAVAQNAQSREIGFDGFEDYGYRTDACKKCILNRHIDVGSTANLVDTMSHTGLYSMRVNGNSTANTRIDIGSPAEVGITPELSMKEDSTPIVKTTVHGNGTGLGNYYYTQANGCHPYGEDAQGNPLTQPWYIGTSNIDYKTGGKEITGTCRVEWLYYSFKGFIQPAVSGVYRFFVTADDAMKVYITQDGVERQITKGLKVELDEKSGPEYLATYETDSITLQAGELYPIHVLWNINNAAYQAKLEWESSGSDDRQVRQIVPVTQLYPAGSDLTAIRNATVVKDTNWCVQFRNPTVTHVLNKRFSPLQGQKVVVSAWVKQDGQCISGNYDNAEISLVFNNETGANTFNLKPTGNIIEGWQRVEEILTIPQTATSLEFNLKSTSGIPVFFDDIRIQPFNANMKSFVYNPVNLRLMAELDENNYATFYEYDDEGTLIRLKKETEQGIKTIKETRSALQKE